MKNDDSCPQRGVRVFAARRCGRDVRETKLRASWLCALGASEADRLASQKLSVRKPKSAKRTRASGVDVAELRRRNGDVEAADESVRRRRERAKVPWTILARMEEEKRAMVRVLAMSWFGEC